MADKEKTEEKESTNKESTNKEEKKPFKPSKKLIIIIIAATVVLLLLIATIVSATLLTKKSDKEKVDVQTEELLLLVPMREFVVNLIDYGGRRFLKTTIDLEVDNEEVKKEIKGKGGEGGEGAGGSAGKETILRNYIINILSSKTFNDVKSVEGKNELRKAIITKCNLILKTGKVLNVYFNEFIIQ
ncbi:MAG: flagellar basal body-associated FliL family protein [Candidatus Riflemargulisbacteria bacterium]